MANPKDLPRDIGGFIRDLRRNAKISVRQLAEQAGVSNPYLSQIERGLRKPSAEVLQQIASALRVSTPAMYLRAGLLEDKDGQSVLDAIAADRDLTISQKQALSQIYETFRRENARLAETAPGNPAATDQSPTEAVLESVAVTETGETPVPSKPEGTTGMTAETVVETNTGKAAAPNKEADTDKEADTTAEEEKR